ncbi:hypothetical protein TNCV_3811271 [Trichonephila clavipes]|nr:hypothetical protein TNCV_3811271 [Trichonephila clavipes]
MAAGPRVQALVLLNTYYVEGRIHIKSVVKSSHVGVVWKFGEGYGNLGVILMKLGNVTPYPHTSCESGVSLKSKGRIEAVTTVSPHTNTIVITAEIESRFVSKYDLVLFRFSLVSSFVAPLQMEESTGGR